MKTFLLDTNVLLADPGSLKVFDDNEIIIPLVVLDELDNAKNRLDEVGRNARHVAHMLDDLRKVGSLSEGVKLNRSIIKIGLNVCENLPSILSTDKVDNKIIGTALWLKQDGKVVIVVSKDINLRVKCDALGLEAQDYTKGKVAQNVSSIYSGIEEIIVPSEMIDKLYSDKFIEPEFSGHPNQFFLLTAEGNVKQSCIAKFVKGKNNIANKLVPLKIPKEIMNISPRNAEQKMAVSLLLDPNVKLVTLIGKAGSGKAQPLDADILTPKGYIKMRDVSVGSCVSTPDGKNAVVSGIFPQGKIDIYKISFSDGTSTECSLDHLWYTETVLDRGQKRKGSVKTTKEIMDTLTYGKNKTRNHSVPYVSNMDFISDKTLNIDPYVLGLLLGDGSFRDQCPAYTTADEELVNSINFLLPECNLLKKENTKYAYYFSNKTKRTLKKIICAKNEKESLSFISLGQLKESGFTYSKVYQAISLKKKYKGLFWNFSEENIINSSNQLKHFLIELGLYNKKSQEKFIPEEYKFTTFKNRLAILQGLMDTDGSISEDGSYMEFSSTSKQLAEDVYFLTQSLGGRATLSYRTTKSCAHSYRVFISLPGEIIPFRLKRKIDRINFSKKPRIRVISAIELIGQKEAQCIYIEHPEHLYVTNNFIVTHNTLLATAAALHHVITECKTYDRVLISRPIQPMGRDIGFLPGSIEEKLQPWMQPIFDNLELILGSEFRNSSLYEGLIQVEPLTYIRGRSIPKSFIILDEAQNMSAQEIKTVITRVGENTKIVITGDISQIDNPYVDFADNGLTHVVEKFKDQEIAGHVTLTKGERSNLATLASELL